jgi:hypothetical protein
MKTVTYVPGTFVTLVSGPHKGGRRGIFDNDDFIYFFSSAVTAREAEWIGTVASRRE